MEGIVPQDDLAVASKALAGLSELRSRIGETLDGDEVLALRITTLPALLDSYALRYRVYCLERGFLPAADYPAQIESDEYDPSSLHFGAYHGDGTLVGTVRLILGDRIELPIQTKCPIEPAKVAWSRGAEISRLAVSRETSGTMSKHLQIRRQNKIVLALYKGIYQAARRRRIDKLYAAMEPCLPRLLMRFSFPFQQIGDPFDHFGMVAPFVLDLDTLDAALAARRPDILNDFRLGLDLDVEPAAEPEEADRRSAA